MKRFVVLFMAMLIGVLSYAQNRVVTGTVTSDQGRPVPFASVVVKGQRTGTTSDENGNFRLSVGNNVTTLLLVPQASLPRISCLNQGQITQYLLIPVLLIL